MKKGGIKHCTKCGIKFQSNTPWHRYCSHACAEWCHRRKRGEVEDNPIRFCRQCGKEFIRKQGSLRHCSIECSKKSARESRCKFFEKNPEKMNVYRMNAKKKGIPGGNMMRLRSRYPLLPKKCQSCGEDRVLDVAHRPEHKRQGAWRSAANCTPEKIWILCPTCHALIDRMGYQPSALGLV